MPEIADGERAYVQGSGRDPYELRNVGGVYSCSCPAWRNVGGPIDRRTCKHLKAYRGAALEAARLGGDVPVPQARPVRASVTTPAGSVPPEDDDDAGAPVLLAQKWESHLDVTGWWMSEKLDGVRAYWDGTQFLSRLGNRFHAPAWFTAGLPAQPLDGELWVGRKQFQTTVSIVRRMDAGKEWASLKFLVFDAPSLDAPFEERVGWLHGVLPNATHARTVEHVCCEGIAHLRGELERVEGLGGEGLMVRQPGSKYEIGRSYTLLKVKTFHDAEGRVVGHDPGKGKHKGRCGALVVAMPDGTTFNVGTGLSDDERRDPPPIGAIVTYRYQELSRDGVPRFPSYVGLAVDKAGPTPAR